MKLELTKTQTPVEVRFFIFKNSIYPDWRCGSNTTITMLQGAYKPYQKM
jgi:hypothetical protein